MSRATNMQSLCSIFLSMFNIRFYTLLAYACLMFSICVSDFFVFLGRNLSKYIHLLNIHTFSYKVCPETGVEVG